MAWSNDLFKNNYKEFHQPGAFTEPDTEASNNPRSNHLTKPRGRTYRQVLSIGLPPPHTDRDISQKRLGPTSNDHIVQYTQEHTETVQMDLDVEPPTVPDKGQPSGLVPGYKRSNSLETTTELTQPTSNPVDKPALDSSSTAATGNSLVQSLKAASKIRPDASSTTKTHYTDRCQLYGRTNIRHQNQIYPGRNQTKRRGHPQ